MNPAPAIEASGVRLDDAGVPVIDGLSLVTRGERVLVLGAARALFEAASGLRPVARGVLRVRGAAPQAAAARALTAAAPLDPPLPADWSLRTYVLWSARLGGAHEGVARGQAHDALVALGLEGLADLRLAKAARDVRRATVIAAAMATGARLLFIEAPAQGLPEPVAGRLARAIAQGLAGRSWVLFAPRIALASPFALAADEALVVHGAVVEAAGAPSALAASAATFAITVEGDASPLAARLAAEGASVSEASLREGAPASFVVALSPGQTTRDVLAAAAAVERTILELRPIARALG